MRENAGLITIDKGHAGRRARTWITLTKGGQAALAEEIARLKLLINLASYLCHAWRQRRISTNP